MFLLYVYTFSICSCHVVLKVYLLTYVIVTKNSSQSNDTAVTVTVPMVLHTFHIHRHVVIVRVNYIEDSMKYYSHNTILMCNNLHNYDN